MLSGPQSRCERGGKDKNSQDSRHPHVTFSMLYMYDMETMNMKRYRETSNWMAYPLCQESERHVSNRDFNKWIKFLETYISPTTLMLSRQAYISLLLCLTVMELLHELTCPLLLFCIL